MYDSFNRKIDYLRFSVTDRCDLRCKYCMPVNMKFTDKKDMLSLLDMKKIVSIFLKIGFRKIKITGGEPLVRKDIVKFLEFLSKNLKKGRLNEISLSTNGNLLKKYYLDIVKNNIKRVNVSLDSLIPEKYQFITNGGKLKNVIDGIELLKRQSLKVKINTVLIKKFNDDELINLILWCSRNKFDISFIETMPLGEIGSSRRLQYFSTEDAKKIINKEFLLKKSGYQTPGPSRYFCSEKLNCKIGFISPISENFCQSCNRVRVTSNGILFSCLGHNHSFDMKKYLVEKKINLLETKVKEMIFNKPEKHFFKIEDSDTTIKRFMNLTGG
ncbi:MAG: GTP 3',8-cyclase MoaA [Rickettsiales bacterium]|nr:GTP 3',8-cyclase MoaA [Rickettsiales bacterium]